MHDRNRITAMREASEGGYCGPSMPLPLFWLVVVPSRLGEVDEASTLRVGGTVEGLPGDAQVAKPALAVGAGRWEAQAQARRCGIDGCSRPLAMRLLSPCAGAPAGTLDCLAVAECA